VQEGNTGSKAPGTLNLFASDNNVFINGSVYARGDLDSIRTIVTACPWLTIRKEGDKVADDACYAVINVSVAPVLLEVDVTFVGVSDAEATTLGANLLQNGLAVISATAQVAGGLAHGSPQTSGSYLVQGNMGDTIQAISGGAGIGPARFSSVGHMTFKNDAADWKVFHDGGTIELPVSGGISGSVGIQPIDYGLILKAKGGLADAENVSLDLNVEMSVPVPQGSSIAGPIYNLKRSRMESTVVCPIGKTLIMGGTKQLTEGININSETPILGQIPVLQFLFSSRTKSKTDRQVLILISPQIARAPIAAAPASDQTVDTQAKADKPLSILQPKLK
jgi:Flp pilus assembly secretin CpaC